MDSELRTILSTYSKCFWSVSKALCACQTSQKLNVRSKTSSSGKSRSSSTQLRLAVFSTSRLFDTIYLWETPRLSMFIARYLCTHHSQNWWCSPRFFFLNRPWPFNIYIQKHMFLVSDTIAALIMTELAPQFSVKRLDNALCSWQCSHTPRNFGEYIYKEMRLCLRSICANFHISDLKSLKPLCFSQCAKCGNIGDSLYLLKCQSCFCHHYIYHSEIGDLTQRIFYFSSTNINTKRIIVQRFDSLLKSRLTKWLALW